MSGTMSRGMGVETSEPPSFLGRAVRAFGHCLLLAAVCLCWSLLCARLSPAWPDGLAGGQAVHNQIIELEQRLDKFLVGQDNNNIST